VWTETSCENGIIYNSTCYKIHREPVNWFTAVNRCLSNNGSLAVFDDHIYIYFTSTLLVKGPLWIGLIKSRWTWPDAGSYYTVIDVHVHFRYFYLLPFNVLIRLYFLLTNMLAYCIRPVRQKNTVVRFIHTRYKVSEMFRQT